MKNVWVQTEQVAAAWFADLRPLAETPELLLRLIDKILGTGEAERILLPAARTTGATRPIRDNFAPNFQRDQVIDISSLASGQTASEVAYYDNDDSVVVRGTSDLGSLMAALMPDRVDTMYRCPGYATARLSGVKLDYRTGIHRAMVNPYWIRVDLHSDIWFPFINGLPHPACDMVRFFDNRELARRHTPRLNAFLSKMNELVISAGGHMRADRDDCFATLLPWISDTGILLDGPVPPLMPPSLTDGEWPDADSETDDE